jgi:hypothetical protein
MSEDFDLYSGTSRNLYGGQRSKGLNNCSLLDINASTLLSQVIWYVDEPPTKARIDDLGFGHAGLDKKIADNCPLYISKQMYNYPLCSGKITLMAPVIDPLRSSCDIIFYEELTVSPKGRGPVKFADIFEALYNFYNTFDPSEDLMDTLTTLITNGGAAFKKGDRDDIDIFNKAKRAVQGVRMNLQVPQVDLLGTTRRFLGLIAWGDGTFFVKLGTEPTSRSTARTALENASLDVPKAA